jgi:natural product precursor
MSLYLQSAESLALKNQTVITNLTILLIMKSLKMNSLSQNALEAREMRELVGAGPACGCGCNGPSSTYDNGTANHAGGKHSKGSMTEQVWFLDEVVCRP